MTNHDRMMYTILAAIFVIPLGVAFGAIILDYFGLVPMKGY